MVGKNVVWIGIGVWLLVGEWCCFIECGDGSELVKIFVRIVCWW